MLAVSVEALVGAVCADHRIPAVEIPEVMSRARCRIDDDYDVTYYTTESLYGLIEAAGFGDIEIQTSHFVVDGPFQNRLEQLDLSDPKTVEKIIQLDIHMSGVPDLAGLGRVLLATARKPEQP